MAAVEVVNLFYLCRLICHGLLMSCFLLLMDSIHVLQVPEVPQFLAVHLAEVCGCQSAI